MAGTGGESAETRGAAQTRAMTYCVVPRELASKLHDVLRQHFRDDPAIEVVVDRRGCERRAAEDRRHAPEAAAAPWTGVERRLIRNPGGRRVADRRAAVLAVDAPPLPRRARAHAARLVFVERLEGGELEAEDADTARMITRIQAGERELFSQLYVRYFDRVYAYLRLVLASAESAEDAVQQAFMKALEALPAYERRSQPFRAWLFTIVRNGGVDELRRSRRTALVDPFELDRQRELPDRGSEPLSALQWVTDRDLLTLIERLPVAQRHVLAMRYMLDLSFVEIAATLDATPAEVRGLHHRAVRFLEARLTALGYAPTHGRLVRARCRPKQLRVIRMRRFALIP